MSSSRDDQQRTNSLAFAKVDCYTCSALKTPCNRQRPWCGTCISNQRKCGGFKMSLVWKDSISPAFSAETSGTSDPSTLNTSPTYQPESSHRKRQEFKFIQGRSKRKRRLKLSDQIRETYPAADNGSHSGGNISNASISRFSDIQVVSQHLPDEQTLSIPELRYQSQAHKYNAILDIYHDEFCIVPLSMDCSSNPFRSPIRRCGDNEFLLHAILAVSLQHLAKKSNSAALTVEMHNHWSTAIHLFSTASMQSKLSALLDTILILFHFDTTQSATGKWGMHLNGARKLLESAEALSWWQRSPRACAQVGMLVWWDITIAFIARKEPQLPLQYLEELIEHDETAGWSFFILSGCPPEFIMAMGRLAQLSATYEKTLQQERVIFNRHPVDSIVHEVKTFINKNDATFHNLEVIDEDLTARRDRYHCVEAWRSSILLYVCRVFTREQNDHGIRLIEYLARITLDHIRCIPQQSVLQKQVLLPIFLAASEADDEKDRWFVRQYCRHWSITSRFHMYETTGALLEHIWEDWNPSTKAVFWWGAKVGCGGSQHAGDKDQHMVSQLLLG